MSTNSDVDLKREEFSIHTWCNSICKSTKLNYDMVLTSISKDNKPSHLKWGHLQVQLKQIHFICQLRNEIRYETSYKKVSP